MDQLLAHLVGDYLLQNKWIAEKKITNFFVALLHGVLYTLPFIFITTNPHALLIIGASHVLIDYYRVGEVAMWLSGQFAPKGYRSSLGEYMKDFPHEPKWITFWLRVITDNTIHLLINFTTIQYIS